MKKTHEPLERLLSVRETSEVYGVSEKTIRRMIKDGRIQTVRVGRQLRIPPRTVRSAIERGKV